jgi:hypothetical protein
VTTPDHVTLTYAAEALERSAKYNDDGARRLVDGRTVDGRLLKQHSAHLLAVAAWLRELVREGDQPVFGGPILDALREGVALAGVDVVAIAKPGDTCPMCTEYPVDAGFRVLELQRRHPIDTAAEDKERGR